MEVGEVCTAVEDCSVVVLVSLEITLPDSGLSYTERTNIHVYEPPHEKTCLRGFPTR